MTRKRRQAAEPDDELDVSGEEEAAMGRENQAAVTAAARTAVVVSHRITAIRDADLIVVLERGRVVETGWHEELFERRGVYWKLLRPQQAEEEVVVG